MTGKVWPETMNAFAKMGPVPISVSGRLRDDRKVPGGVTLMDDATIRALTAPSARRQAELDRQDRMNREANARLDTFNLVPGNWEGDPLGQLIHANEVLLASLTPPTYLISAEALAAGYGVVPRETVKETVKRVWDAIYLGSWDYESPHAVPAIVLRHEVRVPPFTMSATARRVRNADGTYSFERVWA